MLGSPVAFDEYRIVELLGRGAMGQVHLAQDTLLDRLVAVKFIATRVPDVVTIHRVGEVDGQPDLVSMRRPSCRTPRASAWSMPRPSLLRWFHQGERYCTAHAACRGFTGEGHGLGYMLLPAKTQSRSARASSRLTPIERAQRDDPRRERERSARSIEARIACAKVAVSTRRRRHGWQ